MGLGDPLAHDGGVASGIQRGAVGGELAVELGDLLAQPGYLAGRLIGPGKITRKSASRHT